MYEMLPMSFVEKIIYFEVRTVYVFLRVTLLKVIVLFRILGKW